PPFQDFAKRQKAETTDAQAPGFPGPAAGRTRGRPGPSRLGQLRRGEHHHGRGADPDIELQQSACDRYREGSRQSVDRHAGAGVAHAGARRAGPVRGGRQDDQGRGLRFQGRPRRDAGRAYHRRRQDRRDALMLVLAEAPQFLVALEQSAFAMAIRQSVWAYPLANVGHIVALTLFAGSVAVMDLRLLGAFAATPPAAILRPARTAAILGLLLMALTGFALFAAEASHVSMNPVFQVKAGLIGLG